MADELDGMAVFLGVAEMRGFRAGAYSSIDAGDKTPSG